MNKFIYFTWLRRRVGLINNLKDVWLKLLFLSIKFSLTSTSFIEKSRRKISRNIIHSIPILVWGSENETRLVAKFNSAESHSWLSKVVNSSAESINKEDCNLWIMASFLLVVKFKTVNIVRQISTDMSYMILSPEEEKLNGKLLICCCVSLCQVFYYELNYYFIAFTNTAATRNKQSVWQVESLSSQLFNIQSASAPQQISWDKLSQTELTWRSPSCFVFARRKHFSHSVTSKNISESLNVMKMYEATRKFRKHLCGKILILLGFSELNLWTDYVI